MDVNVANTSWNGNINHSGTLSNSGTVSSNGIVLDTHIHGGVMSGPAKTGAPE
jgi:phage baseplate assembly protein gpV